MLHSKENDWIQVICQLIGQIWTILLYITGGAGTVSLVTSKFRRKDKEEKKE